MSNPIVSQVVQRLEMLPQELQLRVLDYIKILHTEPQTELPGKALLSFAGQIEESDLKIMQQRIEEDCAKVDLHEW